MGEGAADFKKNLPCDKLWHLSCLIKTPHLWSGKWHLFSVAFWKMKISSTWLRHREGMERSFFKKAKPQKKKSWFLSLAVWLLHNLELNYVKSLLYTQLHKLSRLLPCPGLYSIHVFANRILIWIVLRNLRWIYFFHGNFVMYTMIEGGESAIIVWSVTT